MFSLSSKDYNEILMNKINEINTIKESIDSSNSEIEKRLKIIELQNKVNIVLLEKIKHSKNEDHILLLDSINNNFKITGITVHPKLVGTHNNILNLSVSEKGVYHFREDVEALIEDKDITFILKHDSILDKEVSLITSNEPEIEIEINKKSNKLSPFIINSFEVDTYIQDVMSIEKMSFYNKGTLTKEINGINKIGTSLHPINETIEFDNIKIKISSHYQDEDTDEYIFPIKHLYFYNSVYDKNSYCIYKKELDEPISFIEDKIKIINHKEEYFTNFRKSDINIFMDPDLTLEILPDVIIAKDITTLYIKIPLVKDGKIESIKSLKFFEKYR